MSAVGRGTVPLLFVSEMEETVDFVDVVVELVVLS